ncbi:MAG: hypothetical protein DCC49_13665 [Acidobacteria bacterium]|nr:MAG: hypothetical protein DCC49_13665 [Acidobacteriota bacterium]
MLAAVVAALLVLGLTACGKKDSGDSEGPMTAKLESAKVINTDVAQGPNRLVISLRDSEGKLVSDPNLKTKVRVFPAGSDKVASEAASEFVWIHEGDRGLYTAHVDIPEAGQWEVEVAPVSDPGVALRALVKASSRSSTPPIGSDAPKTQTKTSASSGGDLRAISTDDKPDPDLYKMSIADAVASGRPTVIAFSTPARCSSNMCGPVVDVIKAAKRSHPEANFIHVEIYDEPQNLNNDAVVPAVKEWGLPTEPWVFVVDASGKVTHKFESIISQHEIDQALAKR